MEIDRSISRMRAEQKKLKRMADLFEKYYAGKLSEKKLKISIRAVGYTDDHILPQDSISELREQARRITPYIKKRKDDLYAELAKFNGVREFRNEFANPRNVISIFDSYLTRTLEIQENELTLDLMVVKTCYFKILEDIIKCGFIFNDVRYEFYTASAGQIRTKRSVFIRTDRLAECSDKLMCGLTVDKINSLGGVNTNKYLAYLALSNSATDVWEDFNIEKCIVVDDFETDVVGLVDYIDNNTYEITRRSQEVFVPHTDGCGMILPSVSKKNFMIRLPWIKGLLAVFPFDKFIREANRKSSYVNYGIITDIYGVKHDILAEGIQIILTKSQFKMWGYYENWEEYKRYFIKYQCTAGVCNVEEDEFDHAKINYQMLQTLTDLTDEELHLLCKPTVSKLSNISQDRQTMLKVFGATSANKKRNAFQESLMLYPELLQDEYCRDTLRLIKRKIEREAISGRLDIEGYYTFLIPDLYAVCERIFLHEVDPSGLLKDGEVYCKLFSPGVELDCLRSPHLYLEHAIRVNVAGVNDEAKRWFVTDGIYTSCKDIISKILQFDE